MPLLNEYETLYWDKGCTIAGIDEVGRGPICGPLVVAGVILPIDYQNELINDSKKLSEKKRKLLYDEIIEIASVYCIKIVSPREVDALNIYRATQLAMEEIADELKADYVVTDAMPLLNGIKHTKIIKGDQKSISIAAASIVAKVIRDKIMDEYHEIYPEYGFNKHKGYPTKHHLAMLEEHGILPIYRFTYKPCQKYTCISLDI